MVKGIAAVRRGMAARLVGSGQGEVVAAAAARRRAEVAAATRRHAEVAAAARRRATVATAVGLLPQSFLSGH